MAGRGFAIFQALKKEEEESDQVSAASTSLSGFIIGRGRGGTVHLPYQFAINDDKSEASSTVTATIGRGRGMCASKFVPTKSSDPIKSGSDKDKGSLGAIGGIIAGRGVMASRGETSGRGTGSPFLVPEKSGSGGRSKEQASPMPGGPRDAPAGPPASVHSTVPSQGAIAKKSSVPSAPSTVDFAEKPTIEKHGKSGTEFNSMTNSIQMFCDADAGVFEYEVRFRPPVDNMKLRSSLVYQQKELLGEARTFDGVILFLPKRLPEATTHLVSTDRADGSEINVEIIFKRQKRLGECIQLYNILFEKIFKVLKYKRVGKKNFDPTAPLLLPQHKLEIWPGYVKTVDEQEGGLMLTLDVSHRVLASGTVHEVMVDAYKSNKSTYQETIKQALLGKITLTRYNNQSYRIDDIDFTKTPSDTFKQGDVDVTIADYYLKNYQLQIKDMKQNLLVSRKEIQVSGEKEKREYVFLLVPELCSLTGLSDKMRQNFTVMKDLATFTKITPFQRVEAYKRFVENVNNNAEAKAFLTNWGLRLDPEPLKMMARLLGEEKIIFGRDKEFGAGAQADFSRHATNNEVLEPIAMTTWLLMYVDKDSIQAKAFEDNMLKVCGPTGIRVSSPRHVQLKNDRTETYIASIRKELADRTIQIIVIIFPTLRDDRYAAVKRVLCSELPTPSQVINSKTLRNDAKNRSIVQKILLQMNCKLGGTLWSIKIPLKKTMLCGVDTYHGSDGTTVGGFVASMNEEFTRWSSRPAIQQKREELVNGLTASMGAALRAFKNFNKEYPDRIILYRDGVGDGQLDFVKQYEIPQFKEAFKAIGDDYNPKLTFVVVQKRINTKFFKIVPGKTGKDGLANPPPGSILDHTVTSRFLYDFYLVSQHVREGTTTPSHYIVLDDENDFSPDVLQRLTYKLCYLYYNWPGTVRVPAPCQYAHKLADLVGISVKRQTSEKLADKLYFL